MGKRVADIDGRLRGRTYEEHYGLRPYRYSDLVAEPWVLSPEELGTLLAAAEGAGRLSGEEAKDLGDVDVVVRGRSWTREGEAYLVVEISATVDREDVERAVRRAGILRKVAPEAEGVAVVGGAGDPPGVAPMA
ncbi:hypothetical protein [Thermoflexus sp.]|uniref:hypothetical protein n=1 Tax=Thermoflexus sp. TaxID=1969742 RepID=UPI0035E436D2